MAKKLVIFCLEMVISFEYGLVKYISIGDIIKTSPGFFKDLKNKKILNNFTAFDHSIIWNDDLDIAGSYLWRFGKILE